MRFSPNLYFSPAVLASEKLLRKAKSSEFPKTLYALVLPDGRNRLELWPPALLTKGSFPDYPGTLIGYAASEEEGKVLMASLMTGLFRNGDLSDYRLLIREEPS